MQNSEARTLSSHGSVSSICVSKEPRPSALDDRLLAQPCPLSRVSFTIDPPFFGFAFSSRPKIHNWSTVSAWQVCILQGPYLSPFRNVAPTCPPYGQASSTYRRRPLERALYTLSFLAMVNRHLNEGIAVSPLLILTFHMPHGNGAQGPDVVPYGPDWRGKMYWL
jgi:hypothetical protein